MGFRPPTVSSPRGPVPTIFVVATIIWFIFAYSRQAFGARSLSSGSKPISNLGTAQQSAGAATVSVSAISDVARHFADWPPQAPYDNSFGETGSRLKLIRQWVELAESSAVNDADCDTIHAAVETVIGAQFPFLVRAENKTKPFAALRESFTQERGIVIPTGTKTFRHACHLVATLRQTLRTSLPIEVFYAGEKDLPASQRQTLAQLGQVDGGGGIEFIDVLRRFDDRTLKLATGGWAIKAFAALGSRFAEAVVLDADAVFVQPPDVLLAQRGYAETGALMFHDRLLWQGAFPARHNWWHSQVRQPSGALNRSLVWTQRYAEEADSGVVVLDKGRLGVLLGLLHVAWQNTQAVRDDVTYKLVYGDKESWWLGMELAGAPYSFEKYYAAVAGWPQGQAPDGGSAEAGKICSFVIAHLDEDDRLLWYNGGLPKNKMTLPAMFEVPTHWMVNGTWHKGASKQDMSCMDGKQAVALTDAEFGVLRSSMDVAQGVDKTWSLI